MRVPFSKREIYEMARPLASYQDKSIYATKLEIGQLKWWDYGYLVNLLSSVDPEYSKKVDFQFDVESIPELEIINELALVRRNI